MIETLITVLALVCATSVACLCLIRWHRASGFRAAVYMAFGVFAALVALLNLTALFATDGSFARTATLAYVSFATAVILPGARALGNLTYQAPAEAEREDATI